MIYIFRVGKPVADPWLCRGQARRKRLAGGRIPGYSLPSENPRFGHWLPGLPVSAAFAAAARMQLKRNYMLDTEDLIAAVSSAGGGAGKFPPHQPASDDSKTYGFHTGSEC